MTKRPILCENAARGRSVGKIAGVGEQRGGNAVCVVFGGEVAESGLDRDGRAFDDAG